MTGRIFLHLKINSLEKIVSMLLMMGLLFEPVFPPVLYADSEISVQASPGGTSVPVVPVVDANPTASTPAPPAVTKKEFPKFPTGSQNSIAFLQNQERPVAAAGEDAAKPKEGPAQIEQKNKVKEIRDEKGNLIAKVEETPTGLKITYYNPETGKVWYVVEFFENLDDFHQIYVYDPDGTTLFRIDIHYDKEGHVVLKDVYFYKYNDQEKLPETARFQFDKDNKLTFGQITLPNGRIRVILQSRLDEEYKRWLQWLLRDILKIPPPDKGQAVPPEKKPLTEKERQELFFRIIKTITPFLRLWELWESSSSLGGNLNVPLPKPPPQAAPVPVEQGKGDKVEKIFDKDGKLVMTTEVTPTGTKITYYDPKTGQVTHVVERVQSKQFPGKPSQVFINGPNGESLVLTVYNFNEEGEVTGRVEYIYKYDEKGKLLDWAKFEFGQNDNLKSGVVTTPATPLGKRERQIHPSLLAQEYREWRQWLLRMIGGK